MKFRFIQINRVVKDTGYLLVAIVAILALSFISQGLVFIVECAPEIYFTFALVLLLFLHYQRKDTLFLESLFENSTQIFLLYFLEYLLVQFPFLLLFIIASSWMKIACIFMSAALIAFTGRYIRKGSPSKNKKVSFGFVPLSLFELKFFLERNYSLFYFLILLIGLICLHFAFYFIFIFFYSLYLAEGFKYVENRAMLKWRNRFVAFKLLKNTIAVQVLLVPALLLAVLNNADLILWYLLAYFVALLNLWMFITYKYRHYSPDRVMIGSSNALALFIILNFLPGMFIISLIFSIVNYVKAEKNMNQYYA